MLIEQGAKKIFASAGVSFFKREQMSFEAFKIAIKNLLKSSVIAVGKRLFFDDLFGDFGDSSEALGFIDEGFVIVVSMRVEQSQACEMSGEPELGWSGRK